jgi:hypothetical protein
MMAAPPMAPVVVDQFDLRFVAIVDDIRRRGVQFVENAARVRHAREGVDRSYDRRDGGRTGQTENSSQEQSSIHRILQVCAPLAPNQPEGN